MLQQVLDQYGGERRRRRRVGEEAVGDDLERVVLVDAVHHVLRVATTTHTCRYTHVQTSVQHYVCLVS